MSKDVAITVPPEGALLRSFIDQIPSMVAYWDADCRCRFANRAYERWFGVTPASLLGKHISQLLGPLYELNLPYIQRALRGEAQEFEREIPDPAGGPSRHSLANYLPDVVDGTVRGFYVLVTDVSAIKRAEAALRESEERFRLTIDEAPIGMALVNLDGRFVRVNRALCEIVGYSADELTGLTFQAITHPEDLDVDVELAGKLARGEIPRYQLGKRYLRKDGSVVEIMLSGSALRNGDGTPRYFIAQVEDITERRRVERSQRFLADVGPFLASSLDFEETLTQVADLAVREIADLCIVEAVEEDQVRRIRVSGRDPAKRSVCEALTHIPLDRQRPYLLLEVLETRRPVLHQEVTDEMLVGFSQGEEHLRVLRAAEIRSMVAVPLLGRSRLVGAIAFLSSSRSRRYGLADVQLAEELARRATLSIENAWLYRAATRATQARDDVLGIVAHDLRSPLNGILMQTQLLRRREGDEGGAQARAAAEAIERGARRMNRLIQDLLDVSRVEAGALSVDPGQVPVAEVVGEALEAQRELATAGSLELVTELAPQLPRVWADRHRLLQVFENLVGNAIKFTPPGGRITLGAAGRGGELLFSVKDTGRGVEPADLPRLFDRFWQARHRERQGAGLGLAIVKGIVEAHRGRIWAESAPGQGTCIYFALPVAEGAETRPPSHVQS